MLDGGLQLGFKVQLPVELHPNGGVSLCVIWGVGDGEDNGEGHARGAGGLLADYDEVM
jgi:hypothetical protein